MESLAYIYMALAYEEYQKEISNCMQLELEECQTKHQQTENCDRPLSSAYTNKKRCFFRTAKA